MWDVIVFIPDHCLSIYIFMVWNDTRIRLIRAFLFLNWFSLLINIGNKCMSVYLEIYFTAKYTILVSTCNVFTQLDTENANILKFQEGLSFNRYIGMV